MFPIFNSCLLFVYSDKININSFHSSSFPMVNFCDEVDWLHFKVLWFQYPEDCHFRDCASSPEEPKDWRKTIGTYSTVYCIMIMSEWSDFETQVKDLLQLVIDARAGDNDNELADQDDAGWCSQPDSPTSSTHYKKSLTDDDIVVLCTDFLLAAYETTSNTLGYISYLLALNPDKQDKLCADIDAYYEENEVLAQSFGNYTPGTVVITHYRRPVCMMLHMQLSTWTGSFRSLSGSILLEHCM